MSKPKPTSIEDARRQSAEWGATAKAKIRDDVVSKVETALSQALKNRKTTAEISMNVSDDDWGYIQKILKEEYPGYTLKFQAGQTSSGATNIPDLVAAMNRGPQVITISWS